MKKIKLSGRRGREKFVSVDDDMFEYLSQFKWRMLINNAGLEYVIRTEYNKITKKTDTYFMHRLILGATKGLICDHINHNTLDNQKHNLRLCTHSENMRNRSSSKNSTSKYLGVSWCHNRRCWVAAIASDNIRKTIGLFKTEENAAIAYNIFAEKYHKEFSNYNKAQ